jgi:DNA-binding NarL/FixJ family response regulator
MNREAQERIERIYLYLKTHASGQLHRDMTIDEFKIAIDLAHNGNNAIFVPDSLVKRMKNRDWKRLSQWINKDL